MEEKKSRREIKPSSEAILLSYRQSGHLNLEAILCTVKSILNPGLLDLINSVQPHIEQCSVL